MQRTLSRLKAGLLATAFVAATAPAHAVLIGADTNNPYAFSWSYNTGTSLLTGYGSMTLSGFNSSQLAVNLSLTNTSTLGGIGGERLVGFAFGIDPNATGVGFSDTGDGGMVSASFASGALPANVAGVEICAYGGNNCSGGGNGGIYAGASDSFTVLLSGTWGSSVNIDPIALRYQTGYGSFDFSAGSSSSSTSSSSSGVPEPGSGSLALFGLGLLALGFRQRRQSRQN